MKYVYFFGDGIADGKADDKNMLGGKIYSYCNIVRETKISISILYFNQ